MVGKPTEIKETVQRGIKPTEIKEIADFILEKFYDKKTAGFFDKLPKEDDLGKLKHEEKQFLENCFSSIVFLRMHFLAKEGKYKQAAEKTLMNLADSYLNFGYFAANYAIAVDMLLNTEMTHSL